MSGRRKAQSGHSAPRVVSVRISGPLTALRRPQDSLSVHLCSTAASAWPFLRPNRSQNNPYLSFGRPQVPASLELQMLPFGPAEVRPARGRAPSGRPRRPSPSLSTSGRPHGSLSGGQSSFSRPEEGEQRGERPASWGEPLGRPGPVCDRRAARSFGISGRGALSAPLPLSGLSKGSRPATAWGRPPIWA